MSQKKKLLVVGGCGYIGSHMVSHLLDCGHEVVVLDDLSSGKRSALMGGTLVEGRCGDRALLQDLFSRHRFDGVLHFASFIQVGESVVDPMKYYKNNVAETLVLIEEMIQHDIKHFIFSSTAAVFGEPEYVPIDEQHALRPINPYGLSKLMVEQMLNDFARAYQFNYVCLRYFNAAGADPLARIGENHEPETHLIPLAIRAAMGTGAPLKLFGLDYPTPDGSCVRDYIHVCDLASAHLLALNYLWEGGDSACFNLGNGCGYSVLEVLQAVERVTGNKVPYQEYPRREGDPARLIAHAGKALSQLHWKPEMASLDTIVQHAWQWEKSKNSNVA